MNQKLALLNLLLNSYHFVNHGERAFFLSLWLEDINWHKEYGLFVNKLNSSHGFIVEGFNKAQQEPAMRWRILLNAFTSIFSYGVDDSFKAKSGEAFVDELMQTFSFNR